ncbi:MAG: hypothetical protein JOZ55_11140 [Alphaproteobacteria bacterium]|nr:hypothetical protein [Alphaproteobacteria bacterium]
MGMSFDYRTKESRYEEVQLRRLSKKHRIAMPARAGVLSNELGERMLAAAVGALIGLSFATIWVATTSLWHAF